MKNLVNFKRLNKENGGKFFSQATMDWWNCKIESELLKDKYFVTSERRDIKDAKMFTVRSCDWSDGSVETIDDFNSYDTLGKALTAIKRL